MEEQVAKSDVVLPFAGIAKPAYYLSHPLWTFELDFEQNLKIVRMCVKHGKRVIFPSTSEVYGLSCDEVLDEDESPLIVGAIGKMRWIYSCGKQMMDRVITACGQEKGLRYTIFRPFNWVGPRLDTLADARERTARSITQIVYDVLEKGEVTLVAGGEQRRSFTWIGDGTDALMAMLRNEGGRADGQIFNVGNPGNNASIRELAETIVDVMKEIFPEAKHGIKVKPEALEPADGSVRAKQPMLFPETISGIRRSFTFEQAYFAKISEARKCASRVMATLRLP